MSERKFAGDSSESDEDEEAVYQKLFPKQIKMEDGHEENEEEEEDLGLGKVFYFFKFSIRNMHNNTNAIIFYHYKSCYRVR